MSLGEEGYMGEGSAQRIEINGVSGILIGSNVNVGLTWSGTELPPSRRGDLTVVDFSSESGMIMGRNREGV
jgi:hypothetical protein